MKLKIRVWNPCYIKIRFICSLCLRCPKTIIEEAAKISELKGNQFALPLFLNSSALRLIHIYIVIAHRTYVCVCAYAFCSTVSIYSSCRPNLIDRFASWFFLTHFFHIQNKKKWWLDWPTTIISIRSSGKFYRWVYEFFFFRCFFFLFNRNI